MVPFPNKEGLKEQVCIKDEFRACGILEACGHLGEIQESVRKACPPLRRKLGICQYKGGKAMNEQYSKDCVQVEMGRFLTNTNI